jgi:homoprotocatechuate degradation regulator HpaR
MLLKERLASNWPLCQKFIMIRKSKTGLPVYSQSVAGSLLAAREAVMAPIRPHLRAAGVTEQQWRVMRVLSDNGTMDAGSIAAKALLYPPSVTRIVKELLQRGLVEKTANPGDGRKLSISITGAGQLLVQETGAHTKRLLDMYGAAFGWERLDQFVQEARALADALQQFQPEE